MAEGFEPQPVLTGELLRLRPLRAADFDPLFAAAADPLIWARHPAPDRYRLEPFREFFADALASGGALLAVDAQDGRVIGSSRFHGYDPEAGDVEIGWSFLARTHWGGRHNREMKRLMLGHAFRSSSGWCSWSGRTTSVHSGRWRRSAASASAPAPMRPGGRTSCTRSPAGADRRVCVEDEHMFE